MFRIPGEINSKPFCFENPTTNNSNKLDCNYLKSLKNQDELISLFTSAIQNENYWNAQSPEIKNKLVVLIYKMQCKKQEEGVKLDLLKNAKKITPEIKQIIQDYSFRKNLKSAINLINRKSGNLLLDTSKISHLKPEASPLLPHLIAQNSDTTICINQLIDIFNDLNSSEMNIEILPYFLKLAQECGKEVSSESLLRSYCFFMGLLIDKICSDNFNKSKLNQIKTTLKNDKTELTNEVIILLKDCRTDTKKLKFMLNIFDYLGWNTEIDFFYFLNDPVEFNDKKIELINICKKYIKKITFSTDQWGYDKWNENNKCSFSRGLKNLRFLLNSGTIEDIEKIKFQNCDNLRILPKEIGLLNNLKTLSISFCRNLEDLAEIKNLIQLEHLYIKNFKHEIPQEIEELKNLKSLELDYYLKKEPEINFGHFKKLESLRLLCAKLKSVPEAVWSLSELKELDIFSGSSSKNFKIPFEKIISLKKLENLKLCPSLTLQESLKIFFSFSGQIQRGLFNINKRHYRLRFLLQNATFYLSEKKELAASLGELIMSIDQLIENGKEDEQLLDKLNQELKFLTASLFEISEEQVTACTDKYLNDKKLSYRIRLNRLAWFSNFLTRNSLFSSPLIDKSTYAALEVFFNLTDFSLREDVIKCLLSFYQPENELQLNTWVKGLPQLKNWQILPHLFVTATGISDAVRKSSIEGLNNRYYQDSTKIKPIVEILHLLLKQENLTKQDFENIIPLILPPFPPLKPKQRGEKDFEKRKQNFLTNQKALREKQLQSIHIIKNLISMQKSAYLKEVTEGNLFQKLQQACKETFGIKQKNTLALFDVFQSQRYPNAILNYASGICTLPENAKNEFMQRLGEFIDDVIEAKFPESRYGISSSDPNHLHLNTVFKMANGEVNQALLEKWKSSFILEIDSSGRSNAGPSTPPHELVKNRILQALSDSHLGPNFNTDYPSLFSLVQQNIVDEKTINNLIEEANSLLFNPSLSEERQKFLTIEIKCLKLLRLNDQLPRSSIILSLKDLEADILEDQFKQDLKDIIALLQPKNLNSRYVSIEDTNAWEDWLLMGTEVRSSCQNITGNPNYNKALLSYITDGKYKLIIVRDSDGKIAARCVLRILWDEKAQKPALYMERLYTRYMDDSLKDYIIQGCIKKAEMMGLCLVAESGDSPYQGSLSSLSSPNPYEYVDAERLGIVPTYGKYTLQKDLKLIYKPNE